MKELNQEKKNKTFAETNEFPSDDTKYGTKTATVGKKINTVRPVARLEGNFPILENRTEQTSFRFEFSTTEQGERTVNKVDVRQLEQQCRDLEEQLDQVKLQIVKIVTDKNVVCKENAFLRNYQIAFDSLTEQNEMLKKKLVENTKMLDIQIDNSVVVPETDRTSPDGQEIDKDPMSLFKSSIEYEAEIERLHQENKEMEKKAQKLEENLNKWNELHETNKQLEESLEMMREEFESMEDYWQKKLDTERTFYEDQIKINERQFKELENRLKEYDDALINESNDKPVVIENDHEDDDKLSTIEETFSLECQVELFSFYKIIHL